MKAPALFVALLIGAGSTAFAQQPNETAKASTPVAASASTAAGEAPQPTVKKAAKVRKASAKKKATQSMGAGPESPVTDLSAADRRARIDDAYAAWRALPR